MIHLWISLVLRAQICNQKALFSWFYWLIWKHFMGLCDIDLPWFIVLFCFLPVMTVVADVAWFGEWGPFKFLPCYAAQSGPWAEALAVKWVKPGRGSHWELWFISTHCSGVDMQIQRNECSPFPVEAKKAFTNIKWRGNKGELQTDLWNKIGGIRWKCTKTWFITGFHPRSNQVLIN